MVRTAAMTKAGKPCSWGHFREETEAGFRQAEEGAHQRDRQTGPPARRGGGNGAQPGCGAEMERAVGLFERNREPMLWSQTAHAWTPVPLLLAV